MRLRAIIIIGVFLLVATFASAAPIAHWTFDECSGPTAADVTGNGYTGTLQNGVQWTTDARSGCAVRLDGIDDLISVGVGPVPIQIRLEAWIKLDSLQDGTIISSNAPYILAVRNRKVHGGVFTQQSQWTEIEGTTDLQVGVWYKLAMSYDGSLVRVYVNDQEENRAPKNGLMTSSGNLHLGWGVPGQNQFFHGIIDDAIVYDEATPPLPVTNIGGTSISPLFRTPTNPFTLQFTFRPNQNYPLPNMPPETIVGDLTL